MLRDHSHASLAPMDTIENTDTGDVPYWLAIFQRMTSAHVDSPPNRGSLMEASIVASLMSRDSILQLLDVYNNDAAIA
jgi:hypothetical protein